MPKRKDGMYFPRRIHRNPAFRKLNASSILVLFEFYSRRRVANIPRRGMQVINNGEIIFTYDEAKNKLGIPRSTFRRSIDQLVNLGFIDIAHHGGGMMKDCSKYGISERWRNYGKQEFVRRSRNKDNRKLGFTAENWEKQTGRKRKPQSKIGINNDTCSSITNDTRDHQTTFTPSIIRATHQIDPKYYIQKGLEVLKAMYPARYH